jgi:hypothetical protein
MARLDPVTSIKRRRPRPELRVSRPVLVFDLWREVNELKLEDTWRKHGVNAKTLVKRDDECLIVEVMRKGSTVRRHRIDSSVTLQALTGRLRVFLADRIVELPVGHVIDLAAGEPFEMEAMAETACLLGFRRHVRRPGSWFADPW